MFSHLLFLIIIEILVSLVVGNSVTKHASDNSHQHGPIPCRPIVRPGSSPGNAGVRRCIMRTSDPLVINNADVLILIGGRDDPTRRHYDWNKNSTTTMADLTGGAVSGINETRNIKNGRQFSGTVVSIAGIVYFHHGKDYIRSFLKLEDEAEIDRIYADFYKQYVEFMDAMSTRSTGKLAFRTGGHLTDLVPRFKIDYDPELLIQNFPLVQEIVKNDLEGALTFCYRGYWPHRQIVVENASLHNIPFSVRDFRALGGGCPQSGQYIAVHASEPLNAATAFCCFILTRISEFADSPIILFDDPAIREGAAMVVGATSVKSIYDVHFDAFLRSAWVTDNVLRGHPMSDHEVSFTKDKMYSTFVLQFEHFSGGERHCLSGITSHTLWERVQRPTVDASGVPMKADAAFKRAVDQVAAEVVEALIYYHTARYPMYQRVYDAYCNRAKLTGHKQIVLLTKGGPWKDVLEDIEAETDLTTAPILYSIHPGGHHDNFWVVMTVSRNMRDCRNIPRKPLPWTTREEVQAHTGIDVHSVRTIVQSFDVDCVEASAYTQEDALKLARLACDASDRVQTPFHRGGRGRGGPRPRY